MSSYTHRLVAFRAIFGKAGVGSRDVCHRASPTQERWIFWKGSQIRTRRETKPGKAGEEAKHTRVALLWTSWWFCYTCSYTLLEFCVATEGEINQLCCPQHFEHPAYKWCQSVSIPFRFHSGSKSLPISHQFCAGLVPDLGRSLWLLCALIHWQKGLTDVLVLGLGLMMQWNNSNVTYITRSFPTNSNGRVVLAAWLDHILPEQRMCVVLLRMNVGKVGGTWFFMCGGPLDLKNRRTKQVCPQQVCSPGMATNLTCSILACVGNRLDVGICVGIHLFSVCHDRTQMRRTVSTTWSGGQWKGGILGPCNGMVVDRVWSCQDMSRFWNSCFWPPNSQWIQPTS